MAGLGVERVTADDIAAELASRGAGGGSAAPGGVTLDAVNAELARRGVAVPPAAPTAEAPTLGRSLSQSLGRGELNVENAMMRLLTGLPRAMAGPSGLQEAVQGGTLNDLATVAAPVVAPGATLGGVAAETAARRLGASGGSAQTANTVGQIGTAAAPIAAGALARTVARLAPSVPKTVFGQEFSPRAVRSFTELGGAPPGAESGVPGDFPREAGRYVGYWSPPSPGDLALIARAQTGDSALLDVFRHVVYLGAGGAAGEALGHPFLGMYAARTLGPEITKALQGFATQALTNPVTRPLTRQLLRAAPGSPDFARLATVVVSQLGVPAPDQPPSEPGPAPPPPAPSPTRRRTTPSTTSPALGGPRF